MCSVIVGMEEWGKSGLDVLMCVKIILVNKIVVSKYPKMVHHKMLLVCFASFQNVCIKRCMQKEKKCDSYIKTCE